MSRFDKKLVNETWEIEVTESGRKRAVGTENGRTVKVWVSDIKDDDGLYPIRGRYLLPLPDVTLVDDQLDEIRTLWVTRDQYKKIMKEAKVPIKQAGFEDILHAVAKLFDKVGDKIKDAIGVDKAFEGIIDQIFDAALDKVMDKDFIIDKIGSIKF
jgi:hypothetical protein